MLFPESDRVIYRHNPLAEVICQLRYPRILRIERDVPSDFQEQIRAEYPTVNEVPAFPPIPPEVLSLAGIDAGAFARRAFDFLSPDGIWKISLASEFLALTSTKYSRWEDFRKRLESITGILVDTYQIPRFERVGLRYRDLIRRSDLGVDGQPWSTLLRRELLGELVAEGFESLEQDARS